MSYVAANSRYSSFGAHSEMLHFRAFGQELIGIWPRKRVSFQELAIIRLRIPQFRQRTVALGEYSVDFPCHPTTIVGQAGPLY